MDNRTKMEELLRLNMLKKINAILDVRYPAVNEEDLLQFERNHEIRLPTSYRDFLLHCDGGSVVDLNIGFSLKSRSIDFKSGCEFILYYFLSFRNHQPPGGGTIADDIAIQKEWLLQDFGLEYDYTRDFIPIALTGENMRICMGCSSEYYGKIYMFDAFNNFPDAVDKIYIPLADSFEQFILETLQPCNEEHKAILNERMKNASNELDG